MKWMINQKIQFHIFWFLFLGITTLGSSSPAQECVLDNPFSFALICQSGLSGMSEEECYREYCESPDTIKNSAPDCISITESWLGFYRLENTCEETIYLTINGSGVQGKASCQQLFENIKLPPKSESNAFDTVLLRYSDEDELVNTYGWCQSRDPNSRRCLVNFCPREKQISEYESSIGQESNRTTQTQRANDHIPFSISDAQYVLTQCEYDPGPIDGIWGRKTENAAKNYITNHGGLPASGPTNLLIQMESYNSRCPQQTQNSVPYNQQNLGQNLVGYDFNGRNLSGYDFSYTDLSTVNFSNANLSNANFTGSNLALTNFTEANLTNATLDNTNMRSADLNKVLGQGASFRRADLTGSNLTQADFRDTDFTDAKLRDARISGLIFSTGAEIDIEALFSTRTESPWEIERISQQWLDQSTPRKNLLEVITLGLDTEGNYIVIGE